MRAPATKSAAAIVQFKDETVIRAETDGFVDEILVRNGDAVRKGMTLVHLRNPELQLEIVRLQQESESAKIQARVWHQSGDIAQSLAELEKLAGLKKQLDEKLQQRELLEVKAPFDGFVFQRDLEARVGSFVKRGDSILSMAQEATKEIIVVVDQRDWESFKDSVANERVARKMRVVLPAMRTFQSAMSHIETRASELPTHPSLCASAGGPLPIRPERSGDSADSDERLLSPHFTVELEVDPRIGAQLKSGQRGRAFFETAQRSFGSFLFVAGEEWLKHKIDLATQTAAF
jgi:putative peptide zinc metalloprotease protein